MQRIQSRLPCRELRPFVRAYAQRQISDSSIEILQPMPACLEGIMELDFGNPPVVESVNGSVMEATRTSLVGPGTHRRHWIRLRSPMESFGIFFQPLGVRQLFAVPARLFVNQEYAGFDILGKGILRLWDRMAEQKSFDARVRIVEEYLISVADRATPCTAIMESARYIFRKHGAIRVGEIADQTSVGRRQYERRFLDEIGMSPKLFACITRYQMAMDAKVARPGLSWLAIAHDFGYHDQMHMIRDFRRLSGDSPRGILSQLGDMRPDALAASGFDQGVTATG